MGFAEKRKYKRVKRPFTASIRPFQETTDANAQGKWDIVTMKDLSASGVLINYTKIIPVGTVLEFNIALPFTEKPIYCLGRVCRIDDTHVEKIKSPRIPVYWIAVSFTDMNETKKQAILKYTDTFK